MAQNLIAIYSQTGVFLHYLPGHEEDQVLLDGKLEILERPGSPTKNSSLVIIWSTTQSQNSSKNSENISQTQRRNEKNSSFINSPHERKRYDSENRQDWMVVEDHEIETIPEKARADSQNLICFDEELEKDKEVTVVTAEPKKLNLPSSTDLLESDPAPESPSRTKSLDKQTSLTPLSFKIHLNQLKKVKKSPSNVGWNWIVLEILDGVTLPAFHFHAGGAEAFLTILKNYVVLNEDAKNCNHFNVTLVNKEALVRSLDELNIFGNSKDVLDGGAQRIRDVINRKNINTFMKDPVRGALQGFSRVGGLLTTVLENNPKNRPISPVSPVNEFEPDGHDDFWKQEEKEDYELISAPQNDIERIINTSSALRFF